MDDIDETMLAGLSEKDLKELSELIDPDVSHYTLFLYIRSQITP